jgi:hypothetical protein
METAKVSTEEQVSYETIENLIAIGGATASNCIPCFEHLYEKAISCGISIAEIERAAEIAAQVNNGAHIAMKNRKNGIIGKEGTHELPCNKTENISVDNVKVRLHRARKKFKTIPEEECRFEVDERNVLICDPINNS